MPIISTRWGIIKGGFSKQARPLFNRPEWINPSKAKPRESTIWQRRFWEHEIRDQEDFNRHFDYIHWNPVKRGMSPVWPIGRIPHSTAMCAPAFIPEDFGE